MICRIRKLLAASFRELDPGERAGLSRINTYIYIYVCMYVCMHVCMYVCVYIYIYIYMIIVVYVAIHTHRISLSDVGTS